MTIANRKRIFGDKIAFKSLSCAPVNELGYNVSEFVFPPREEVEAP
jgi:hypothetical protein